MALSPDEFYAHAIAAADAEQRLPLAKMTYWDIFPFDEDGLTVAPLRPPVVPEKRRNGENGVDCFSCANSDQGIWLNDDWRLTRIRGVGVPLVLMLHPRRHVDLAELPDELAGQLGRLTVQIARSVEAIPHIARCHVYRIGDGGAHMHVWFFGRPEGQSQLYGSLLPVWDDLLPDYPADIAEADARAVAATLLDSFGGRLTEAAP
jgi:diadenosine tetraphosphate (Ap4A) HIT family hydrolase